MTAATTPTKPRRRRGTTPKPRRRRTMSILDACDDPNLFRPWFRRPESWRAWRVFHAALFGLPIEGEDLELFKQCTGRTEAPTGPMDEAWMVIGRRGGKSFAGMALTGVYLGAFTDYREYLQPGERATIPILAADRRQARTIFRFVRGLLVNVPMLRKMVERETADSFDLTNGTTLEIGTASYRAARGYTIPAALCDEIAFWRTDDDAANPDVEIINALRPAMATIPGAKLICGSSPYAKRGALHDSFARYWGKPGSILVWKAPTRTMNPSVPQRVIDEATERDPAAAASEYGAEFRTDISAFVDRAIAESCVDWNELERPYNPALRYTAFVDPSGGSSDSFTMAIAHKVKSTDTVVVDVVREMPAPFDPESVVEEFAKVLHSYNVRDVVGDRYAGEWPREQFRKRRITYTPSEQPKSGLYVDLLPRLNSRTIRLVDNPRLVNQIAGLERRTSRSGKDSIDHPPTGKDDVANAVAGVAAHVLNQHTASSEPLRI